MGAIYGALVHPIVYKWTILLHGSWLAAGKWKYFIIKTSFSLGGPCGVMVKVMDCRIVVSKFKFQLRYYDHFRTNTLGKGMNPLILPAMD